jgi:ADP-heptose:LPS heptosyltransferase
MQEKKSSDYLLIISSDMGLGNFLLVEPILRHFKFIENAIIKCVSFDNTTPIKYIESLGYIDEIIFLFQHSILNRFKILKRVIHVICLIKILRDQKNNNIILFGRHTYSIKNIILALAVGGKRSYINVLRDDRYVFVYKLLGCHINYYDFEAHEFHNNVVLAKMISMKASIEESFRFPCASDAGMLAPPPSTTYVLIQAIGGNVQPWKLWLKDNWKEIILKLARRGILVYLTGSYDERAEVEVLRQSVIEVDESITGCVKNISGDLDLFGLGLYVKKAALVITADGMLGHVAAAFNTKTICLIGPGGDGRRPLNENCTVILADCDCNKSKSINRIAQLKIERCGGSCMNKISINKVYDEVAFYLSL